LKGAVSGTERAREREMALEDASRPMDIDRERGEQRMRGRDAKDVHWANGRMDRPRDERESASKCFWGDDPQRATRRGFQVIFNILGHPGLPKA
jgi:hypothetical protein